MKDAHRRKAKLDEKSKKPLPRIDPSLIISPVYQDRLVCTHGAIKTLAVQGNEFIATSNFSWGLSMYQLDNTDEKDDVSCFDSMSELSEIDDDVIPNDVRKPIWNQIATPKTTDNDVAFITKDVVACVDEEGFMSTWCVRSGNRLGIVEMKRARIKHAMCKLTETEFVAGSEQGHLCFFTHDKGCNVKESKRIWFAHRSFVLALDVNNDRLISGSYDNSACVWDTKNKKQTAVLHHNGQVCSIATSDAYIVTVSANDLEFVSDLRVYSNDEKCTLLRVWQTNLGLGALRFLPSGLLSYVLFDGTLNRRFLVFFDLNSGRVLGQLKVACRQINVWQPLNDGRIAIGGHGGCRGVIVTLPKFARPLLILRNYSEKLVVKKRHGCVLM